MVARIVVGEPAERPDPRRFAIVGLTATAIDFGLAVGLTSAGVSRPLANLLAKLGYQPIHSIEAGMREMKDWAKSNGLFI